LPDFLGPEIISKIEAEWIVSAKKTFRYLASNLKIIIIALFYWIKAIFILFIGLIPFAIATYIIVLVKSQTLVHRTVLGIVIFYFGILSLVESGISVNVKLKNGIFIRLHLEGL